MTSKTTNLDWVGEYPNHWTLKRLKYLVALINENAPVNNMLKKIALENIESYSGKLVNLDSEVEFTGEGKKFDEGDVLFNKLRPYLAKVYKAIDKGVCLGELLVFRPSCEITSDFLFYRVLSEPFISEVNSSTYGSKMPRASWEFIKNLEIPYPSLIEQDDITKYLDLQTYKIDTLISRKQKLIDLLKEERAAVINQAVTKGINPDTEMKDSGIEWLEKLPKHWEVKRLKYLTKGMIAGPFGSSLTKDMYTTGGYRVYGQEQVIPADFTIGDYYISKERYDLMKRYAVAPGDVLISCVGTFGKVAVVPQEAEPGIINPRLVKLIPKMDVTIPTYLGLFLKSRAAFDQMEQVSRGGTMGVINLGLLNDLQFPLPPLSEQQSILFYLNQEITKIDLAKGKIQKEIDLLQEYRTALISEVVTGKIDVRDEVVI